MCVCAKHCANRSFVPMIINGSSSYPHHFHAIHFSIFFHSNHCLRRLCQVALLDYRVGALLAVVCVTEPVQVEPNPHLIRRFLEIGGKLYIEKQIANFAQPNSQNSETLSQVDTSSLVAPEYTLGANWPCCFLFNADKNKKKTKPSSCSVKECHIADFFCRRAAGHRIGLLGNETNCTCSRWVFLDWFFLGKSSEFLWKYFIIVFGPASAKEMRFLSSFLKLHN